MSAPDPPVAGQSLPAVTVIMSLYKPDIAITRRQIESLLAQVGVKLSVVAVLDGPDTAEDKELRALLSAAGFETAVNPEQLGVKAAFARGLRAALARAGSDAACFAYCDQDDVWRPGKLHRSVAVLETTGAALVHCDARVIDSSGFEIAGSLHRYESRSEGGDLLGNLLLNTVTGMTAVFPASTARLALALLEQSESSLLHDHVTAVAAAALGRIVFLDEPLVDYVQHASNQLGARVHQRWRSRALGLGHIGAYRQTSAEMFHERRELAVLLERQGILPGRLAIMFLAGRKPGLVPLVACYDYAMLCLLGRLQFRRATLALRMMDVAFFALWRRRGAATVEEVFPEPPRHGADRPVHEA